MSATPAESAPVVVGLGEVLWDEFADGRRPGGAPANVAYHSCMLGLDGRIASRVGRDQDGDLLVERLRQTALDVELIQTDAELSTGRVTVELDDGQPTYTIHPAAWDNIEATPGLLDVAGGAAAICFGTLAQRSDESRKAIQSCLEATAGLKVYDVNLRQSFYSKPVIEASLQTADVTKLNHEEAAVLAKMFDLPDGDGFGPALREFASLDVVCLTHGADGCELIGESRVFEASEPVEVADAVGAGDAFTAALTYATLQDWPLANRARFANAVGGLVASKRGAMPDTADRVDELKRQHAP